MTVLWSGRRCLKQGDHPEQLKGCNEWGGGEEEYIGVLEAVDGLEQSILVPQPQWGDTQAANGWGDVA